MCGRELAVHGFPTYVPDIGVSSDVGMNGTICCVKRRLSGSVVQIQDEGCDEAWVSSQVVSGWSALVTRDGHA